MNDSFEFVEPGTLEDGELWLRLEYAGQDTTGEEIMPCYRFSMRVTDASEPVGFINLRIGDSDNLVLYRGHIGYAVNEPYRGRKFAARACRLILPLAFRHLDTVWITCNPDNLASRKTCEAIGAMLVETVIVPADTEAYRFGSREKCRYALRGAHHL